MMIHRATEIDRDAVVQLMHRLWPDAAFETLNAEVMLGMRSGQMHYFIATSSPSNLPLGFCQLSFRHDYVPGSDSSPTAFLEGLFVEESARHQQVATRLVEAASQFARSKGCSQLASDTELDNVMSQQFHERSGFEEVERIVCYIKNLSR